MVLRGAFQETRGRKTNSQWWLWGWRRQSKWRGNQWLTPNGKAFPRGLVCATWKNWAVAWERGMRWRGWFETAPAASLGSPSHTPWGIGWWRGCIHFLGLLKQIPETGWLKATEMYSLTSLEARSLKWMCHRTASSIISRVEDFLSFSASRGSCPSLSYLHHSNLCLPCHMTFFPLSLCPNLSSVSVSRSLRPNPVRALLMRTQLTQLRAHLIQW